jgi:hypothetical protein
LTACAEGAEAAVTSAAISAAGSGLLR